MGYALEELGSARCRSIAEGLFTVTKVYGEKLNGHCPVHPQPDKSASFYYDPTKDLYKCRSCEAGGDLVKLWCEINGLDSRGEGFKRFKAEFVGDGGGKPSPRKVRTEPPAKPDPAPIPEVYIDEAVYEALPPLPAERVTELRRLRGWSAGVIEVCGLREFRPPRGESRIAIPIRDDQGRLCNIRLYQPGAAEFKVISWFDQTCTACGGSWKKVDKAKRCSKCGAPPNDYGRTRLWPAPSVWKRAGLLWLCEGEPDTLCALSQGLNAVTQTAGCGTWTDAFSLNMAGRDVVIAYDADGSGHKGASKAAKSIAEHARSVRVIRWPELMGAARG
jgi:putative DNA primase/helicase